MFLLYLGKRAQQVVWQKLVEYIREAENARLMEGYWKFFEVLFRQETDTTEKAANEQCLVNGFYCSKKSDQRVV